MRGPLPASGRGARGARSCRSLSSPLAGGEPAKAGGGGAPRTIALIFTLLALLFPLTPALAQVDDATFAPLVDALAPGNFRDREAAASALAATGDPRAVPVLQTLLDGELYVIEATGKVLLGEGADAIDPVTGAPSAGAAEGRHGEGARQLTASAVASAPPSAS